MKVFNVEYHNISCEPRSTFVLCSSESAAVSYVDKNLGFTDNVSLVSDSFNISFGKVSDCLKSEFSSDEVDLILSVLFRAGLFSIR